MILGVTGGIASGKTTVVQCLGALGAAVVDVDAIARDLTAQGSHLARAILKELGAQYALPGRSDAIDRGALAKAIFSDETLRLRLESIVHPSIISAMRRQIYALKESPEQRLIAVEVPLLFEADLKDDFDQVVVVWCKVHTQMNRLRSRLHDLSDLDITARINSQIPLDQKASLGDFVISSEVDPEEMRRQVSNLFTKLMKVSP
jgi:dephospho-CoA kinase